MRRRIACGVALCLCATVGVLMLGCRAAQPTGAMSVREPSGMPALTEAYRRATAHHTQSMRMPVRQERARAMRVLADKADDVLAETDQWATSPRLMGLSDAAREGVDADVAALRESLANLKAAAGRGDIATTRTEYARTLAAYDRIARQTALN